MSGTNLDQIILEGLDVAKPTPTAGAAGRLYFATDTKTFYRDNGTTWVIEPPSPHATSHHTGGTDALAPADIGAVASSEKGAASGVATLDSSGLVPPAQLPPVAITDTFVVASQAAMLALTAQRGDVAVRTDLNENFILQADDPTVLANWVQLLNPASTPTGSAGGDLAGTYPNPTLANTSTARTNLGLGTSATHDVPASGDASATQVMLGNDSRNTNSRTPTAHRATHEVGGADPLTGIVPGSAFAPSGLTGATAASRYVGATASGAPASGTFAVGDFIIDQTGTLWVCTTAGSPGTWTQITGGGSGATIGSGTLASRPAAGTAGNVYLPTDGLYEYRDTGSAWAAWGPLLPLTPPDPAAFTWVNQGSATLDTAHGAMYMECPPQAGDNLRMQVRSATAGAISVTVMMRIAGAGIAGDRGGLILYDSASGKAQSLSLTNNTNRIAVENWNSFSSLNSTPYDSTGNAIPMQIVFFRITEDATNRKYLVSLDGYHFLTLKSVATGTFVTPNRVGIFASTNTAGGTTAGVGLTLLSWA